MMLSTTITTFDIPLHMFITVIVPAVLKPWKGMENLDGDRLLLFCTGVYESWFWVLCVFRVQMKSWFWNFCITGGYIYIYLVFWARVVVEPDGEKRSVFFLKNRSSKCRGGYMIATVCGYVQVLMRNCWYLWCFCTSVQCCFDAFNKNQSTNLSFHEKNLCLDQFEYFLFA